MQKIASQIADRVLQKLARYPFTARKERFEGSPEEWRESNLQRVQDFKSKAPLLGGLVGAGIGGAGALGGKRLPGTMSKERILVALLGAGALGLLGAGGGYLAGRGVEREAERQTPSDWKRGLETFNRQYGQGE
jgi:hypothetical protein